jgi:DNA-binding IclR family transcriptional regulator
MCNDLPMVGATSVLKTVDRALQLLLSFEEADQEYRVGELATMLGIDKSVASRLAATLAERGFLERDSENGAFRLGPELGRLGLLATSSRRNLVALAQRTMERLAAEVGETAYLGVLEGKKVVNIAQVEGRHLIGVGDWVGWRTEPHCTANGKVLLAFADGKIGDLTLEAFTERTITSADELASELKGVRRDGWAASVGEFEDGLHGVAVPIFDASERCRAALSVAGPSYRMPLSRLPELAALCKEAALEIGTRLGREHDVP